MEKQPNAEINNIPISELSLLVKQYDQQAIVEVTRRLTKSYMYLRHKFKLEEQELQSFVALYVLKLIPAYNPGLSLFTTYFSLCLPSLIWSIFESQNTIHIPRQRITRYVQQIIEIAEGRNDGPRPNNPAIQLRSLDSPVDNSEDAATYYDITPDETITSNEDNLQASALSAKITFLIQRKFDKHDPRIQFILSCLNDYHRYPSRKEILKEYPLEKERLAFMRLIEKVKRHLKKN